MNTKKYEAKCKENPPPIFKIKINKLMNKKEKKL
jgi:hypothetical protein